MAPPALMLICWILYHSGGQDEHSIIHYMYIQSFPLDLYYLHVS